MLHHLEKQDGAVFASCGDVRSGWIRAIRRIEAAGGILRPVPLPADGVERKRAG
jgi:hypothetical protein